MNKTLAYFEALTKLKDHYRRLYDEPKIIKVHPDFSNDPQERAVVMVRENAGVIGLKGNWTKEEIEAGKIPFRLYRVLPYKQKMIEKNLYLTIFPPTKSRKLIRYLNYFLLGLEDIYLKCLIDSC